MGKDRLAAIVKSMRQVKAQYNAMEDELMAIGRELSMEPLNSLEQIKRLSKVREVEDLQARIDCLLKENADLKAQALNREEMLKEAEALTVSWDIQMTW